MPNVLHPARGQRSLKAPPATQCCGLVCSQTDHYQASVPLRIQVQTGINPGKKGKKKEQCLGSAPCQRRVSAVHICNSNAVAGVLRQGCAGPSTSVSPLAHCEEVVSDSRWGCSPIRLRLLEDDEWGWLRGAREKWRHRQTRDAHSCLGE